MGPGLGVGDGDGTWTCVPLRPVRASPCPRCLPWAAFVRLPPCFPAASRLLSVVCLSTLGLCVQLGASSPVCWCGACVYVTGAVCAAGSGAWAADAASDPWGLTAQWGILPAACTSGPLWAQARLFPGWCALWFPGWESEQRGPALSSSWEILKQDSGR